MATDLTTLAAQIEERLTEDETTAKAAGGCRWIGSDNGYEGGGTVEVDHGTSGPWEPVVYDEGRPTTAEAMHIARNDPARVLRRVAVTRELVAAILAEPHDSARNPAGHQRVARLLGIIATEWEEKEDGQ